MIHLAVLSRMGFPIQLKSKLVSIGKEKTIRMIIKGKLSERAVVKENGLGQVCLQERRTTPKRNLVRETTKSKSRMQSVSNGHVGQRARN